MLPLRKNIVEMKGYVPGFQPKDGERTIKINTNENPYPPSPKAIEAIQAALNDDLRKYPDARSQEMRDAAAEVYDFDPSWIIAANGSDEVINNLIRAFVGEGEELGYVHPSYSYYGTLAAIQGAKVRTFGLTEDFRIKNFPERYNGKLFFLVNPHAPLGFLSPKEYVAEIADRCEGVLVVDEAYADFTDSDCLDLVKEKSNVVVTRTFSKSYGLAGMRLGLAVARPEIIEALDKIRDHYNLDRLAQMAGAAALRDQAYLTECVGRIRRTRDRFTKAIQDLGYEVIPSHGNYVFAAPPDRNGERVYQALVERRILVRYFSDPLLKHGLRISIGTDSEMDEVLTALKEIG